MRQLPSLPYLDHPRLRNNGDKYQGGTLIAAHIVTLEQHARALANPDLERPEQCGTCECQRLHVHERRTRLLDGLGSAVVEILIFRCAGCRVTWRVLPGLLPRHLWRTWERVAEALAEARPRSTSPKRTRQRWHRRLRGRARMLVVVLGQLGPRRPRAVAELTLVSMRREVIEAFGGWTCLATLAALIDHLVPGVRVM